MKDIETEKLKKLREQMKNARGGVDANVSNTDKNLFNEHLKSLKSANQSAQDVLMSNKERPKTTFTQKVSGIASKINDALESHKNDFDFVQSLGTDKVTPEQGTNLSSRISNAATSVEARVAGALKTNAKAAVSAFTSSNSDKAKATMFALTSKYGTKAVFTPEYQDAKKQYENSIAADKIKSNQAARKAGQSNEEYQNFRNAATAGLSPTKSKLMNAGLGVADIGADILSGPAAPFLIGAEASADRINKQAKLGNTVQEALIGGLLSGGTTAALSYVPINKFLNTNAAQGVTNGIRNVANISNGEIAKTLGPYVGKNAMTGATLAGANTGSEKLIDMLLNGKSDITTKDIVNSAGQGAITGAALSGIKAIPDTIGLKRMQSQQQQYQNDLLKQQENYNNWKQNNAQTQPLLTDSYPADFYTNSLGNTMDKSKYINDNTVQNKLLTQPVKQEPTAGSIYPIYNGKQVLSNNPTQNILLNGSTNSETIPKSINGNTALDGNIASERNEVSKQAIVKADYSKFDENILKDNNSVRKNLLSYATEHFPKNVIVKSNGMRVEITKTGLNKLLSGRISKDKYASAFYVPDILKNAYNATYKDYDTPYGKSKENIKGYTYMQSNINIGDSPYIAYIRIRHSNNTNNYYGHTLGTGIVDEIKIEPLANGSRPINTTSPVNATKARADAINTSSPFNTNGSINNISQSSESINNSFGKNTVGSAEYNPNSLSGLADKYGYIPDGENPKARVGVVPQAIDDSGKKISQFARTLVEANATPDEFVSDLEKGILDGKFSHMVMTDKNADTYAKDTITKNGYNEALTHWNILTNENKAISKNDIALGMQLYNQAANAGDAKTAMKIAAELAAEETRSGQNLQAARLLKKMTPDGNLYSLEKTVEHLNNVGKDGKGVKTTTGNDIEINEDLAKKLLNSKTPDEMQNNVEAIKNDVAKQIKTSWFERWNEWRYFSMLANPTTHVRNIVGNIMTKGLYSIKDDIGVALENTYDTASKATGGKGLETKTKSFFNPLSSSDKKLLTYAKGDYDTTVKDIIGGENKYNDKTDIMSRRDTFGTTWAGKLLNRAVNFNSNLLNKEDDFSLKQNYSMSLAKYMKANKYTEEYFNSPEGQEAKTKAQQYAIKEAQESTFHDDSEIARKLNSFQKTNKATELFVGGVLPFKKTPINILKRSVEYSPTSVVKGTQELFTAQKDSDDAVNALNKLAKGLTGTGLMMLGAYLASKGIISANLSADDKEQTLQKAEGKQPLSLNLGNKSISLDFSAPSSVPLMLGASVMSAYKNKQNVSGYTVAKAISQISEPLINMSCVNSLQTTLDEIKYGDNPLMDIAVSTGQSYLTSGVPTALGKVARAVDNTNRSTYIDKNSNIPTSVQKALQSIQYKTPIANQKLQPSLDVWGREANTGSALQKIGNNFLNPSTVKNINESDVDKEVLRLYKSTDNSSVMPTKPQKYFNVDGKRYDLSSEQYTKLQKEENGKTYSDIQKLLMDSTYNSLSDEAKASVVSELFDYNKQIAKHSVNPDYDISSSAQKVNDLSSNGISEIQAVLIHQKYKDINNENITSQEKADKLTDYLDSQNLSGSQKDALQDEYSYYSPIRATPTEDKENYQKVNFLSTSQYTTLNNAVSNIKGDKDVNGKTVSLSASKKKKAALDAEIQLQHIDLTRDQLHKLYEVNEISKKVW